MGCGCTLCPNRCDFKVSTISNSFPMAILITDRTMSTPSFTKIAPSSVASIVDMMAIKSFGPRASFTPAKKRGKLFHELLNAFRVDYFLP